MAAAVALWPPWCPAPGAATHNTQQSANMIGDKPMLLKVEDIIVFTIYQLCNGTMRRQRVVSVFACCVGCHWPILAGKLLRWPIPVPLTVVSTWQNQGGQWWEFAIIGGRSHVGGVLWGCLRVIYCSTYVGIIFRSRNLNIFDEHHQNHGNYDHYVSAVPSISPWRLCPRPPDPGESWRSQLSPCVISLGVHTDFHRPGDKRHFPPNFFWIHFYQNSPPWQIT